MVVETWFDISSGPWPVKYRASPNLSWHADEWRLTSSGTQASSNHYPLNTDADSGGAWIMSKREDRCSPTSNFTNKWQGMYTVGNPKTGWNPMSPSGQPSDLSMIDIGATAISRTAPNNPAYSIPQAIGELREGLSPFGFATMKERTRVAKAAGGEYLNVEFGWKPLVSDLQSFARAVNDSSEIWKSYKRGSGRKTRVGYHYPSVYDSQSYRGQLNPVPSSFTHGFLQGDAVQYRSQKTWFKGAFKYYVPMPTDFDSKMDYWQSQANRILGVKLSPDTVWNLNPWTWAADWFANTGDLMTNVSNLGQDGLVLQYGYAMAEETITTHISGFVPSLDQSHTSRYITEKRCKRIPASPYGFGVTLSSLSAKQLAIIAALGLSH